MARPIKYLRESLIEKALIKKVRLSGGECLKWVSPGMSGVPDRIIVTAHGKVSFVELKAANGRLKPLQKAMHDRLIALGCRVVVLDSVEAVDSYEL